MDQSLPRWLLFSAILLGLVAHSRAEVTLRKVQWQALPDAVQQVFVGPDQRLWYVMDGRSDRTDVADLQRRIATEFAKPSPQIEAATPLLFEPGGRVWFRGWGAAQSMLYGYDGKTWVERSIQKGHTFIGSAPNHGRGDVGQNNLYVDGHVFFVDSQGIDCFDGKVWSYKAMTDRPQPWPGVPIMKVEPDGKGLVVLMRLGETSSLWRWRGQWSELPSPGNLGLAAIDFAPATDGIWLFGLFSGLRFHPYDPKLSSAALIKQAASPDASAADMAAGSLAKMGPSVIPDVDAALQSASDQPTITRLQKLIVLLREPRDPLARFGPYDLAGVTNLEYLPNRVTIVAAKQVREGGKDRGPVMIQLKPDGTYQANFDADLAQCWDWRHVHRSGCLVQADGKVWMPGGFGNAASLFDLASGKIVATLPEAQYGFLQAVAGDGTLFVSRTAPGPRAGPVMAFAPTQPDDRIWLTATETAIAKSGVAVTSGGMVYAVRPDQGLCRFDGDGWAAGQLPDVKQLQWSVSGVNNELLVKFDKTYGFFTGKNWKLDNDLPALIKENRDAIAKAFPHTARGADAGTWVAVTTDSTGNIWLLTDQRLAVLIGDRWEDPALALKAAGSVSGTVRYLSAIGDGSKVYATDFEQTGRRCSVIGQVKDGALTFASGPITSQASLMRLSVREGNGALWVPATWADRKRHPDVLAGQFPQRLTEVGVTAEVTGIGWPRLADRNGNVWFGGTMNDRLEALTLWRDGAAAATIPMSARNDSLLLIDGGPGRVIAWSDAGVQVFTAADPAKPANYTAGPLMSVRGLSARPMHVAFSPRCGLITTETPAIGSQDSRLYLIDLPRK